MNMEFQAAEDRLVLKVNTTDKKEFRLWLTRRFAKQFWDALVKILEQKPEIKEQANPEVKKAMMAMKQENTIKKEQFEQKFEDSAADDPLGEAPVLLTGFSYTPSGPGGVPRMAFQTAKGVEMGLPVNDQILFSLAKLLAQVVAHTGWDLVFDLGFGMEKSGPASAQVH